MKLQERRFSLIGCLFVLLTVAGFGVSGHHRSGFQPHQNSVGKSVESVESKRVLSKYGQLPLRFEANRGQLASPVKFTSRNPSHTLFLTANEAVLELQKQGSKTQRENESANFAPSQPESAIVKMKLVGASPESNVIALDELPGKSNYFIGDDPRRWRTNVANFARVKYDEIYPGIDLIWHGNQRQLEHDFLVAAGANPNRIRLTFTGAETIQINNAGDLVLQTEAGELKLQKPVAWQEADGQRQPVDCQFALDDKRQVGFRLGNYDHNRELVIDPVLLYSTFIGGGGFEQGLGVAVDKDFNAYIVGYTSSTDFPGGSPIQPGLGSNGLADAFVLKLNPSGTGVVYGTYLGGTSDDLALGVAVDKDGNAYVTGYTFSTNFPKTTGAFQESNKGLADGFVAKINAAGSTLVYSSYVGGGGDDAFWNVAVDAAGNAYLGGTTQSANLPATGIQQNRGSQPVFKSSDRAANWAAVSNTLNVTQVQAIAIDPTNSAVLYAGAQQGVYKSADGGQTWQQTGQSSPATRPSSVNAIAIDPSNPSRVYVAARSGGIFRSTDGGQSYQANVGINWGNNFPSAYSVVVDSSAPNILYLGTVRGAYASADAGNTWTTLNNGLQLPNISQIPRVNQIVIDRNNHQIIYAATSTNVFKSFDSGTVWSPANTGLTQGAFADVATLTIDPVSTATLYAGTAGFSGGLFKTTDGGTVWRASNTGLTPPNSTAPLSVLSLAIDSSNTQTVYAATNAGIYKSLDGGASWNNSSTGLPGVLANAVVIDRANPTNVYVSISAGTDGLAAKVNSTGSALSWLTYLGGAASDEARGVAVDKDGNCYVTGTTISLNYPMANPFQAVIGGGSDAFVTKVNPTGTALVYSTYFGGRSTEFGRGIAVNDVGQVFITGSTLSDNLPVKNPLQPSLGGLSNDVFVAKFNAAGSALEYSTWLGGSGNDNGYAIAVDGAGNAYVTGDTSSTNFPLVDALQTQLRQTDAFVAKLNPTGTALIYSTFFGGNSTEVGNGIAVDALGNAYVVGNTNSQSFPTANPLQPVIRGSSDAFIAKLGNDADLAITKTVSRNPVMVGNNFGYELTVTNNGPSLATGITVTDVLPAGISFVSAATSQGSCANNSGTVTCNVGNLAIQASAAITLTVSATAAGSVTNTASVKASEPDSNAANNQASALVTVSSQPSVYGRITLANGNPLPNVTISLTGALSANQQTNAQGRFQFSNLLPSGNYTITPTSSAYSFEPAVRDFNLVTADQAGNFVATLCTYSLFATNQSFEANGGNGSFNVTAQPRCGWTASTDASWIKITSGSSGVGNGSVSFSVEPTTVPRNGRITVAGQTFVVWQGVGGCANPVFRAKQYYYPFDPKLLASADFNRDGLTDLLVAPTNTLFSPSLPDLGYPIGIFWGETNGGQFFGQPIYTQRQPVAVTTGDFNGDGNADVVSIGAFTEEAGIFLNDGAGRFGSGLPARVIPRSSTNYPSKLFTPDLNKDGKSDLVAVYNSNTLTVILSSSPGSVVGFGAPVRIFLSGNLLGFADVNNDKVPDAIAAPVGGTTSGGSLLVYPGDGFGSFGAPVTSAISNPVFNGDFGDFNADGKLDITVMITVSTPQGSRFSPAVLYGDGKGKFDSQVSYSQLLFQSVLKVAVRDLNRDAKQDVVILTTGGIVALFGGNDGKPGSSVVLASSQESLGELAIGNFDASGKPGIATINFISKRVLVYANSCATDGIAIYGRVNDRALSSGIGGVTMKLSGAKAATTTTDSGGNYQFSGLQRGAYTVTPERASTDIIPASRSFNITADQVADFDGARRAAAVSAASYSGESVAPGSIIALFGNEMTSRTEIANQQPLPQLLGGVNVIFQNNVVAGYGQLFFISPNQINLLVPADLPPGVVVAQIFAPGILAEPFTTSTVTIERVSPGLFSADASGRGLPAAVVLRVKADGSQVYEPVTRFDQTQNKFVALPIDVSNPAEQVILLMFGTGIRGRSSLANVLAKVGGEMVETSYAGPQGDFVGLDQINLRLPGNLTGRGNVDILLTVDGKTANTVQINIK